MRLEDSTPPAGTTMKRLLAKADNLTPLMDRFGRYMVPGAILSHWPKSPPVTRFGQSATPLQDTGRLRDSIRAIPSARDLVLRSDMPQAKLLQGREDGRDTIVRPVTAKWLTLPIYPALSISEIHAHRSPRAYSDLFVMMHGPEGPGLYRALTAGMRSRRGSTVNRDRSGVRVQMVFRFVKEVSIHARRFLFFSDGDRVVLRKMAAEYFR